MSDAKKTESEKIAEYRHGIAMAIVAARAMASVDVPTLLEAMPYADSFGPLLDPTLWRDKQRQMELEALFPFNPTSGPQSVQGADDDGCPV